MEATMRKLLAAGFAAVLVGVVTPHGAAVADNVGSFHFRMPDGWKPCAGPEGYQVLCPPEGNARIGIMSPAKGADAASLARNEALENGEILKDMEATLAGKPGHLVVAMKDEMVVAAAATLDAGGVVVVMLAPKAEAQSTVHVWSALVDGAQIAGAGDDSGSLWPVGDEKQPPDHKLTLKNGVPGCTATMFIDGEKYEVPAGGSLDVMIHKGKHVFEWQNADGTFGNATGEAPPVENFTGGCVPGAAPQPNHPETPQTPQVDTPTPLAADADKRAIFEGARAAVMFYRTAWNLVQGGPDWGMPRSIDRMALKLLARKPHAKRNDLTAYTQYNQLLQAAVQRTQGNPAARAGLRRVAYVLLLGAAQVGVPDTCAMRTQQPTDQDRVQALDCMVGRMSNAPASDVVDQMNEVFLRGVANVEGPANEMMATLQKLGQ
jgi:hypothetical protein